MLMLELRWKLTILMVEIMGLEDRREELENKSNARDKEVGKTIGESGGGGNRW